MFKIKFLLGCIVLLNICFSACKNEPKVASPTLNLPALPAREAEPELTLEGAIPYKVSEGIIYWQGRKTITNTFHNGEIKLAGGEIMVKEGRIVSGSIKIDMKSLTATDLSDPKEKASLEEHLKSADFFDVEKYPFAEYKIEDALPSRIPSYDRAIVGNLTIKDKSNGVNIPTKLTIDKSSLVANSLTFQISRTDWGINFGSGVIGTAKDKAIDDIILFSLKMTAKP
jgi:polyisoprenoid-binding protein YceI